MKNKSSASKQSTNKSDQTRNSTNSHASQYETIKRALRGPGIEVVVGSSDVLNGPSTCYWTLPKALISQHSPFLKAACDRNFCEREENRILLPDDEPAVFDLFVQWLYYGKYTHISTTKHEPGLDAQAWVLADKLLSTGFKNHAMTHIFDKHACKIGYVPVSPVHIDFAVTNSRFDSKMSEFFLRRVARWFKKSNFVSGTAEEWDKLFQKHADARKFFLRLSQYQDQDAWDAALLKEYYMETKQESKDRPSVSDNVVIPAKRNADGDTVKKETAEQ